MALKMEKLVVDANAFIKAYPLQEFTITVYTVPDVIKEIRDSATRNALQCTVYELIQKEPTPDSIKRATEYSKSTGDYQSLSLVDIKVIALGIELFEESNEKKIEFKEAKVRSVLGSGVTPEEKARNPDAAKPVENAGLPIGFHMPKVNLDKHNEHFKLYPYVGKYSYSTQDEALYERIMEIGGLSAVGAQYPHLRRWLAHVETLLQSGVEPEAPEDNANDSEDEEEGGTEGREEVLLSESDSDYNSHDNEEEEDEDDDDGWITPSNYKQKKAADAPTPATSSVVGVLSTDFAIQNVILHTNIPLLSPYGQQITTLRSYILRCYACFHTTSQFDKQFCPRCGNKTLRRISVSIDEKGQMKLHFSSKYVLTSKGKKFSLPKPQGGKHAVNPILSEDQHTTPNYRSKKAVVREIGPFSLNDVSTRSFVVKKGQGVCYWNAKNPNATRPKGGRK